MGLLLITPPAAEPISVADAATHLRLDPTNVDPDTDVYVAALIQAAREYAEMYTRRAFVTQGWRLTLDTFPQGDTIELPRPPLRSVSSITYLDPAGVPQTMNPANYAVDTNGLTGRIVLAYAQYWPFTRLVRNSVTIDFTCGYGADPSTVPASVKHAMKLLVGNWYSHREAFEAKRFAIEIPFAVDALLTSQRVLEAA